MSLASDIADKFIHKKETKRRCLSPEQYKPSPVVHIKPKKNIHPVSTRGQHMARIPGMRHTENGWFVTFWHPDYGMSHVGTFKSLSRARIALNLFLYWIKAGYTPDQIPCKMSSRLRKHGVRRNENL